MGKPIKSVGEYISSQQEALVKPFGGLALEIKREKTPTWRI
jgi:hypothetical protein